MEKIKRDENGRYVWEYVVDLNTNKNIYYLVMKILTAIFAFILIVIPLIAAFNRSFSMDSLLSFMAIALPIFLFVYLVGFLAYRFYSWSLGGEYHVRFEMDDEGVRHIPMERERDYNKNIGLMSMIVGFFTGSFGQMGSGMYIASLEDIYSEFDKVASIHTDRKHDLINVNYLTLNNQVYAEAEDYDFVLNYIIDHCPQARVVDGK